MGNIEHEIAVKAFFDECKKDCPKKYEEVCEKYPVQTPTRRAAIRRREITVGLLGLSASRVSLGTATRYDVDSVYANHDDQ